jgi:hypothetical protein
MARLLLLMAMGYVLFAQAPKVGGINFYGLQKVSADRILSTVKLHTGDPLPQSKGDLEDRISEVPGIVLAHVEAVCCDGPAAILFIGIEERGAPHAAFRSEPAGEAVLPEDLMKSYSDFLAAVRAAAAHGNSAEDLTAGHSLMADPAARAFQLRFVTFATENLPLLRDVLRNASIPEQRAAAAAVIAYAPNKQDVVNDLQFALSDPDEAVRANAIRALVSVAVLASRQPSLGLKIAPTWFIELLHSVVLSDRVESVKALLTLTDKPAPSALTQIRERALPALAEMARWSAPQYAAPPFLLLGRIAGMSDEQAEAAWEKGQRERESVIEKALSGK